MVDLWSRISYESQSRAEGDSGSGNGAIGRRGRGEDREEGRGAVKEKDQLLWETPIGTRRAVGQRA